MLVQRLQAHNEARAAAVSVIVLIIVGITAGLLTLPWPAMVILSVASIAAFVGWMKTTYRYPAVSRRVVATYLCAIAFQFIHMSEEYLGGFPREFTLLFHTREWSERSFLLTFVFGFGAIWVLAGAGALYRLRLANYFLWFYALGAGLVNAISHFVFPIIKGGYFPGLYTAAGHLLFSAALIWTMVSEARAQGSETTRLRAAEPP